MSIGKIQSDILNICENIYTLAKKENYIADEDFYVYKLARNEAILIKQVNNLDKYLSVKLLKGDFDKSNKFYCNEGTIYLQFYISENGIWGYSVREKSDINKYGTLNESLLDAHSIDRYLIIKTHLIRSLRNSKISILIN